VSEIAFAHFSSPANTEWANGTTANYNTLSYTDWNSWAKGVNAGPESTVGIDAVVHLKAEDIYIDIKFLAWGSGGFYSSGFSYSRSTPAAANNPPSVTVTNPVNGASFTAPCTLTIAASASDSDGTVTNVQFFDGAVSLGSVAANPFSVTRTCQAGTHVLKAVATDNLGASTTSSIVTITVTNALPGALSIQNQGDSVVLNWTGSFPLQTATSLGGSNFVDIAGVTNSPYTNLINTSFRLFRLRGN
jgi:hypothetical protein